jgi:hypothetical protein
MVKRSSHKRAYATPDNTEGTTQRDGNNTENNTEGRFFCVVCDTKEPSLSYTPHPCQEAKIGRPFLPSEEGRGHLYHQPIHHPEMSPLKTPALRHFQIRRHRPDRPTLHKIRQGGLSLSSSLLSHAPYIASMRCARGTRELPDAL